MKEGGVTVVSKPIWEETDPIDRSHDKTVYNMTELICFSILQERGKSGISHLIPLEMIVIYGVGPNPTKEMFQFCFGPFLLVLLFYL